ncbi:unnamed protein product [Protopolystoma xenopodis]|uniref:Uncharacterized protein n=1 Tax=Protopolystoma xenopodis TaxID=117903 RepID=A0A448XKE8_9PLAT|nr:unnamed protein product [Protopolystoma xenopodis]
MLRSLVGLLDEGVKGSQTDKHGPDTYRLHAEHANRTEDNFHSRGTVGVAEACYDASVNLERGIRSNAVIINTLDGGGYTRGERNRSFLDQIERKLCEINRIVDEATVEMTDTLKQQTNPTILHKKCRQESAVNGSTGEVKIAPKEVSVHNDIVQHKLNVIFRLEKELSSLIHELRRKHNEHGISPLLPKLASTVSNLSNFSTDALAVKAPNYRVPLFAENLSYSPKVINEAVGVHHTFRLEKGISSDANPKPEIGFGIERTPTPMFRSFSSHESNQLSSSTQIDTEPIVAFGLADNRLEVDKSEGSDKKAIPVLVEPHKRDEEGEREDKIKIVSEAGLNLTDSSTMAQKCRPDSNSNSILSEILRLPSLRHISFDVSMAEPEMRESFRIVQPFVCPDASDSLQRDFSVLKRLTSQEYSDNAIMITTLDLVDQVLANVSCDMLAMLDSFASLTFSVSTKEINPPSLTYRPTVETIETEPPDLEVRVIGPDVLPISECNATAHGLTQPLLLDSQNEASPRISETLDLCPRLSSDSLSTVKPEEEKSSSESRDTEESPQTSNKESCKSSGEYSNEEKSEVEHESDKMTVSNVPSLNTSGFIARNGGYNEREVEEYSNKRIKALPQIDKYLPQYSIELSPSDDTTSASSITSSPNK